MKAILTAFFLVRILETTGHLPPLAASYADDLLCLPLVLGAILWCHRRLGNSMAGGTLPHSHGLLTLALFAIYFEGLLPRLKTTAVADPWDLLMYLAGYLFFEAVINKPPRLIRQDHCQVSA